jgi:hypothetical protein
VIALLVAIIGIYLIFFGEKVKVITKLRRIVPKIEMKNISK